MSATAKRITTIRPEINVPVLLTPKYADYAPSKQGFADQLRLKSAEGEALYTSLDLVGPLVTAGVLREDGTDRDGHPAYRVQRSVELRYTRKEKAPPQVAVDGVLIYPDPEPAAPAKPAPPKAIASKAAAEPEADAKPDPAYRPVYGWAQLALTYAKCTEIARKVWGPEHDPQALAAAAATLFIEANRRGLVGQPKAPPPPAPEPPARASVRPVAEPTFDDFPEAEASDEDDPLPFD